MRKGWRTLIAGVGVALIGGLIPAATRAGFAEMAAGGGDHRPVRLTVEIAWASAAGSAAPSGEAGPGGVELEVPGGRIIGAVACPVAGHAAEAVAPERTGEGVWRLGGPARGRARVRVEAPVGAALVLRAGGTPMRFPLPLVLEGPQRTPPQSPVEIAVERVPWDAIDVNLGGESADGVAAPGARVPVAVAFHVLTPDPQEVTVRCTAELRPARGGEPVWRHEARTSVPTNAAPPPLLTLPLDAPADEGTYVLEVRATWEAVAAHEGGKFINRLIRRGKRGLFGPATATRRVTLAVLGADAPAPAAAGPEAESATETEADAVDLARPRGYRPWGSGRSPAAGGASITSAGDAPWTVPSEALAPAGARDRLRGLIGRGGMEAGVLGPADATGLAWSSLGLRVAHPGRPHRLTVTIAAGHPAALGVALVAAPSGAGTGTAAGSGSGSGHGPAGPPRRLLDARASGPPVPPDGPPATFSWLVWPDTPDPVLVLVNRSTGAPVRVGTVTLTELSALPAGPVVEAPAGAAARSLGLYLGGPDGLDRFGGTLDGGLTDALAASNHLAGYAASCGATAVVLPEGLADRDRRRALDGTAAEDATGPDRLDLALRVLGRRGLATWLELDLDGPLPGLPDPAAPEALARGLVRVDRQGQADGPAPTYHPLGAEVAAALRRRVAGAAAAHKGRDGFAGVVVRLGRGPTLPGSPDTGFDDATFARFIREAFDPETARSLPGRSNDDPNRFAARASFLGGSGRMPWLSWRSKRVAALYAELAAAAREAAPGTALAVATPGPDDGPAGTEARRADLAGLPPNLAWRAVGLDLDAWPRGAGAPVVLRGVAVGPDALAHDLATSPELDAEVAARPARGLLVDAPPAASAGAAVALTAAGLGDGPEGDEPLGHSLAALDARYVWLAAAAVAGHEERLRQFARVFRALPATPPAERRPLPFGVAVRAHPAGEATYLAMANDTPYPVRLDTLLAGPDPAPIFDLGRAVTLKPAAGPSGRHLVLDLPPFGVAAVRVGAAGVKVGTITPYPSEAALTVLKARYQDVSAQLTRLNHGGGRAAGPGRPAGESRDGPPNPGFEPHPPEPGPGSEPAPDAGPAPAPAPAPPGGWQLLGGMGNGVVIDPVEPHSGRGALRLDAPNPPASAASDGFTPGIRSSLLVRVWLRSDRPDARVRLWIEGESAGAPYHRVSDMTVAPGWAERAVRAADVPAGGLDSLRLRFELLTAGSLWVDDLSVSGAALSEPEHRNARLALVAALQAYRERRFADFARLAGSRWARRTAGGRDGAPERLASERDGLTAPGDASALPPARRLR